MNIDNRLVIDSRLEEIARARDWLAERVSQAMLSRETVGDLKLALTEALSNVICHSYDSEPGHQIILSLFVDDKALTLTIRDFGRPFDASLYQMPDLDKLQEGGYGVFLIQSLMDQVRYDTSSGVGTTLTLVKQRDRQRSKKPGNLYTSL